MRRLTVLYDDRCALCVRCRDMLATSETFLPLELLPTSSNEARHRYGAVPWLGEELVVASDEGDIWVGPAAFLMCLWAMRETREWAYRLSTPALAPLAERVFAALSANRGRIAAFMQPRCEDESCDVHPAPIEHARRWTYR
ncbi:MAG: DUF393 domain-containing protein [Polyangiaceae bacterium]|nr:DUF393 domain-containing protein [Polyangiaceae bacterium]